MSSRNIMASPTDSHADDADGWIKTVEMTELLFFRHAESYNNVLYDYIRKKYGHDISESFIEEQERNLRQQDSNLSEKGYQQLSMLEAFAKNGYLHDAVNHSDVSSNDNSLSDWIIVSSPMKRCLLTAQALANGLNKPVVYVHPLLYESGGCHGIASTSSSNPDIKETIGFPGSTSEEVEKEFTTFKCLPGMEKGWYYGRDKEETFQEFQSRCNGLIQWLWSLHNTKENDRYLYQDMASGMPRGKFKNMMILIHGNLLNGLISGLQSGNGLITHNNTGYSHVQLITGRYQKQYAVVKYISRIDHLLSNNTNGKNGRAIQTSTDNIEKDIIMPTKKITLESSTELINNDKNISSSSSSKSVENILITGNDTIKDHWLQEFQPNY